MVWTAKFILLDTITDEKKEFVEDFTFSRDDDKEDITNVIEYIITEGNKGCDCNRFDLFYPDSDEDFPCNTHENRFKLLKLDIYLDDMRMFSETYS